jgi:DnaJ-class molecular chaperone
MALTNPQEILDLAARHERAGDLTTASTLRHLLAVAMPAHASKLVCKTCGGCGRRYPYLTPGCTEYHTRCVSCGGSGAAQ